MSKDTYTIEKQIMLDLEKKHTLPKLDLAFKIRYCDLNGHTNLIKKTTIHGTKTYCHNCQRWT